MGQLGKGAKQLLQGEKRGSVCECPSSPESRRRSSFRHAPLVVGMVLTRCSWRKKLRPGPLPQKLNTGIEVKAFPAGCKSCSAGNSAPPFLTQMAPLSKEWVAKAPDCTVHATAAIQVEQMLAGPCPTAKRPQEGVLSPSSCSSPQNTSSPATFAPVVFWTYICEV